MNSKLSNFINFFIEIIYLLAIFLVPLYFGFLFISENPFELHKAFIFKSLFYPFALLSIIKILFFSKSFTGFPCLFRRYFLLPIFLLFFLLISVFWAVDPSLAFWGSASRQMGWVSEFLFFLFFVFLLINIVLSKNKNKTINRILFTIFISSLLVSIYAVLQYFAIDFLNWEEPAHITKRSMSSLGQPNFLASFLLLTSPIILYFINICKKRYLKIFLYLSLVIHFLAIIFSGSRGAWMALVVSFVLFLFIFYFKNKKIFTISLFSLFLFLLIFLLSNNSFSQRFYSSLNFSEGSSSARIALWNSSIKSFFKKDWGYGIENQKEAIINYYQGDWASFARVNVIFDRSHNIFLDHLLSVGFFGTVFYLFFYFFIFKLIFKNIEDDESAFLSRIIFWSLSAYLISLLFNFSVFVTNFYFWILFAIVGAINFNEFQLCSNFENEDDSSNKNLIESTEDIEEDISEKRPLLTFFKITILLLLFPVMFFALNRELKNLKADYYFLNAKNFFKQGEIPASILTFSYVRSESPIFLVYYYDYISIIFDNYNNFQDETSKFLATEELKKVWDKLEKKDIESFDFILARAQINSIFGNFLEAEKDFNNLKSRSINFPNIYFKEAKMNYMKKDYEKSLLLYQEALSLLPDIQKIESERSVKALNFYKNSIEKDIELINSNILYTNNY